MIEKPSLADDISAAFGDDGQVWEIGNGHGHEDVHIVNVCHVFSRREHTTDGGQVTKYVFRDGSAIVIYGNGWDKGFPEVDLSRFSGCFCMEESGHDDSCPIR